MLINILQLCGMVEGANMAKSNKNAVEEHEALLTSGKH